MVEGMSLHYALSMIFCSEKVSSAVIIDVGKNSAPRVGLMTMFFVAISNLTFPGAESEPQIGLIFACRAGVITNFAISRLFMYYSHIFCLYPEPAKHQDEHVFIKIVS